MLEALDIATPGVQLAETFDDGPAPFAAVCEHGMEGVVAKRERDPYRPGERLWVEHKNRDTVRFAEELHVGRAAGRAALSLRGVYITD